MNKKLTLTLALIIAGITAASACTNFLVGKNASADGSTMVTYSADSYSLFGFLSHYPAATYPEGAMRKVYDWDSGVYLGQIPEARVTYNVVGNMNEHQLTIGETTYGGRPELVDTTGMIDYGSLIYITLQRAKTAREAIKTMAELVKTYGYYSSGESFSIADPNEVWIMELIGKGPGNKGAVWVARLMPSDCVSAHANQARITTFQLEKGSKGKSISDKNLKKIFNPEVETVYASDVISFAREKGYFEGRDEDFSFSDTYAPLDWSGLRICEARVWSFFRAVNPEMDKYYSYINGETKERMPLWIKPAKKVSAQDLKGYMRDHYEGTPLDMTKGIGAGAYNSPYRATPLIFTVDSVDYYHERPTATQQTGFTFVAQMRSWMPDPVGGILWFGLDDATCNVYVPIYCCITEIPRSMREGNGDMLTFSWASAFWVNNWVANMVYYRYSQMMPIVAERQNALESQFNEAVKETDAHALKLYKESTADVVPFLTDFSKTQARVAMRTWKKLGEYLIVKFMDGVVKGEKDGKFERTPEGIPANIGRPGYPADGFNKREFVDPDPERFRFRTKEEMDNRK